MRFKTNKKLSLVFALLSVIMACVIWNFSLQNATQSNMAGESVMSILKKFFSIFTDGDLEMSMRLLRKIAHFTEFSLLGVFIFFALLFYNIVSPIRRMYAFFSLFALGVAVTDECIQFFSPGRAPAFTDVLIDFAGAALGFSVCLLIYCFIKNRYLKKKNPAD